MRVTLRDAFTYIWNQARWEHYRNLSDKEGLPGSLCGGTTGDEQPAVGLAPHARRRHAFGAALRFPKHAAVRAVHPSPPWFSATAQPRWTGGPVRVMVGDDGEETTRTRDRHEAGSFMKGLKSIGAPYKGKTLVSRIVGARSARSRQMGGLRRHTQGGHWPSPLWEFIKCCRRVGEFHPTGGHSGPRVRATG